MSSGALLRQGKTYYLGVGPFLQGAQNSNFSFFSPNFFMDDELELKTPTHCFQIDEDQFKLRLDEFLKSAPEVRKLKWVEPSLETYHQVFDIIKNEIESGQLKKAVPVLFAKAQEQISALRIAHILSHLSQQASRIYVYGMWNEKSGMLGASPELLLSIHAGELQSMALAGTQIKNSESCCLLEDPKELYEHQLVVEDIENVLNGYGELKSRGPEILELPSLWHLKTEIRMKLSGNPHPIELIKKLHPTPALGVSPRQFDYRWMRGFPEAEIRHKFGGAFALVFPERECISVVAIRNIQWNQNSILLGAGGGVVRESQLEKEWQELEAKRSSVKEMTGL